ncbi:MAG TPA: matrixin family metalloprotease [Gemmatimonadaceae bacterium]
MPARSVRLAFARRALTVALAGLIGLGGVDCSAFASSGYDGILDGTLSGSVRATASLDQVMLGATGTYIDRVLAERDSTLERWPDRLGQPLRVWIDSSDALTGAQAGFPAAVRFAFDQWMSTGIPVRLAYVTSERGANIRVRWTEYLNRKTGSTTWRTDRAGYLTGGEITLATHVSDGQPLDARGMRAIALHEVGHALGLSHSLDGRDVMASLVRVDGLSESDRGTLKLLYSLPAGHVR